MNMIGVHATNVIKTAQTITNPSDRPFLTKVLIESGRFSSRSQTISTMQADITASTPSNRDRRPFQAGVYRELRFVTIRTKTAGEEIGSRLIDQPEQEGHGPEGAGRFLKTYHPQEILQQLDVITVIDDVLDVSRDGENTGWHTNIVAFIYGESTSNSEREPGLRDFKQNASSTIPGVQIGSRNGAQDVPKKAVQLHPPAKTRPFPKAAAASEKPRLVLHPPAPSLPTQALFPGRYVEALSDARTKHRKGAA
ncbi:MAG: hypothetical protein H0W13_07245 [Nitrospirales bacterium]|nr:hypothetical protein [Nitrospirales bacterium]